MGVVCSWERVIGVGVYPHISPNKGPFMYQSSLHFFIQTGKKTVDWH